jgi:RNAse (barnase) inhibitor barstar
MHFFNGRGQENGITIDVPAGITDKYFLFDFYSHVFHFPDWFGRNWDALLDCLRDIKDEFNPISIRHSDVPFSLSPNEKESYLDILLLTSTLHKGDVIVTFPDELLEEVDEVIFMYWKKWYKDIKTKGEVLNIVTHLVFPSRSENGSV